MMSPRLVMGIRTSGSEIIGMRRSRRTFDLGVGVDLAQRNMERHTAGALQRGLADDSEVRRFLRAVVGAARPKRAL